MVNSLKTLVVHPGALGDVLLSRKALRTLKQSFPQNSLVWVGKSEIGNLLAVCEEVSSAIPIESRLLADLFCHPTQWNSETHKVLKFCSRIVCWLHDKDDSIRQNFIAYGISSMVIQSPYDSSLSSIHIEDCYQETLNCWHTNMVESFQRLQVVDSAYDQWKSHKIKSAEGDDIQRIVIHPGSGSHHKCADPSLFASVIERLLQVEDRHVIILEGPADKDVVSRLCSLLSSNMYTVLQQQSLVSLTQYFSTVDLFIGNDSGLTHLAVACDLPTIALFGPTDPAQWASREDHAAVITGERCQCEDWSCVRRCDSKPCFNISVDDVVEKAEHWLNLPIALT